MSFSFRYFGVLLLAAAGAYANDTYDPAVVERGRKAFIESCGFCHGNDATGNRAPDLIRSPLANRDENGTLIGPVIKNGRPDKGMPGFPMSAQQISDIATFLHARVNEAMRSAHVGNDYPVEKLLTGNAGKGREYFAGAGGCVNCHSVTGDLAHIAKKYQPIDLQSRFLYPRGAQPTVTVKLPSGQQMEGKLVSIDEFDVAMKDAAGQYHSWPRNRVRVTVHDPLEAHRTLLHNYTDAEVHNVFAYLETLK